MPRIDRITQHEQLPPAAQHFVDRVIRMKGSIFGPYEVLLHTPDVAERIANLSNFLLHESDIPTDLRALTWLVTAVEYDCEYELDLAKAAAQRAGIPDGAVAALRAGRAASGLDRRQQLIVEYCRQLMHGNHHVDDATYQAVIAAVGVPAAVQIALTIGYFVMQAFLLNVFDVRPPADEPPRDL